MPNIKETFTDFIHQLQDEICNGIEELETKVSFKEDLWKRPGGGGGKTRIIQEGNIFEKGGVNTSVVHGALPDILKNNTPTDGAQFYACGLSLVLHPKNPFVPTVHANWRFFEMYDSQGNIIDQWFGGGSDLTPYYLFDEDAKHFHQCQKDTAGKHGSELYSRFKKQCDSYFYNSHRGEARGIGGTFFDHLKASPEKSIEEWMTFTMDMGKSFLNSYLPIVNKRKDTPYNDDHIFWQEIRRGRYVEFNLVHDRGTLFGLKTNGRTESILMSLPPRVRWEYNHQPIKDSNEDKLLHVLKQPKNWI